MNLSLDAYKGKMLDDETLSALLADVAKLVEPLEARALKAEDKARKAAQESIEGRKGKDALIAKALEKLGIESPEDLDNLPDAKGQAEALKQFEAKLKRSERDLAERTKSLEEITTRYSTERRERAISEQVSKHSFIDADDVRALVGARLKEEGDELLFAGPDGQLMPLADGVAWLAKAKPHLVQPAGGAQGSGFKGSKGSPGALRMTRAQFEALPPKERAKAATTDGFVLVDA